MARPTLLLLIALKSFLKGELLSSLSKELIWAQIFSSSCFRLACMHCAKFISCWSLSA